MIARELEAVFGRQARAFEPLSIGLEVRGKDTPPNRELLVRTGEDSSEAPSGNQLASLARESGFKDWIVLRNTSHHRS